MDVLLTGASGFIGQKLLQVLVDKNLCVHALCRQKPSIGFDTRTARIFSGDILDAPSIRRAMEGCDQVYHVAGYAKNWARNPSDYFRVNVQGTRNLLRCALECRVKKVVYTSSAMTIGPSNGLPLDEARIRRTPLLTHYESSKLRAESEVNDACDQGLDVVIVNPTRVFGPGLLTEGNSLTRMIRLYLEGKWRVTPGNGEALGNYAFIDDVVLGHVLAMDRGRTGERYLLGGENTSYNAFFAMLAIVASRRYRLLHLPDWVAVAVSILEERRALWFRGYPTITPGWIRTFLLDNAYSCAKAEQELGYRITPLKDALEKTVEWLVKTRGTSHTGRIE